MTGDAQLFAFVRNVVVAASAGTGKTHRLTALYVLVALGLTSRGERDAGVVADPCLPERIVATTFSRAAAREMRSRIERALAALARWEGSGPRPFEDILAAREAATGVSLGPAEIRARARAALDQLPAARIDTLHGFAGRILRAHALAIGAPAGARMLEEDESRWIGDRAVDEVLSDALGAGGATAAAARALTAACSGVGFARRDLVRLLDRLDEEGLDVAELGLHDHAADAAALGRELYDTTRSLLAGASPPFLEVAEDLASALAALGWESGLGRSSPALDELIVSLWALRMPPEPRRTPGERAAAELRTRVPGRNNRERGQRFAAFLRAGPELTLREQGIRDLCRSAARAFAAAKRHAGALGFGDVLRFAQRGLVDDPGVAERVRRSLDVLLVDEFQDTSRVQRDLVYLAREREGSGRRAGELPRPVHLAPDGLFVVGDRKQSIYGFRGVDVSIFGEVCAALAGAAACEALRLPPSSANPTPIADFVALRETRRSGPAITRFVNELARLDFRAGRDPDAAPSGFEVEYGPAEHLVAAGPDGDEVVLVHDDGGIPDDADALVREATGPAREAFIAAAFVAHEVAERRREGARCPWSDFAILARRRSTIPLVELALGRLGIPFVVAGRALYQASEVRDVAAILRLVLDPRDRAALAIVLRGPAACLSDAALALLAVPGRGLTVSLDPFEGRARRTAADRSRLEREAGLADDDRAHLDAFRARFIAARPALLRTSPADALRRAIRWFEIDRVIAALPRPAARLGNLERLVAIAGRRARSLAAFSRWLDRQIADEVDEAEAVVFSADDDAVRLTTIHGSKGLDFPRVVLVDLGAGPGPARTALGLHPDRAPGEPPRLVVRHVDHDGASIPTASSRVAHAVATQRERAERRRLTYVAITRARRALVLVGTAERDRRDSAMSAVWTGLDGSLGGAVTRTLAASEVLSGAQRVPSIDGAEAADDRAIRPERSTSAQIGLATTPLGIYRGCPRRFELRYLLGLDEPVASGQLDLFEGPDPVPVVVREDDEVDPREVGRAAHRVLERYPASAWGVPTAADQVEPLLEAEGLVAGPHRAERARGIAAFLEGAYARRIGAAGALLLREHAFVLPVERADRRALHLRGAIDLVVLYEDGTADVIDYKDSRPTADLGRYAFQLRAYALVARRRLDRREVRAGVLFLGAAEPVFLGAPGASITDVEHAAFEDELTALADRFATDRYEGRWGGRELPVCRRLSCGFVTACHGGAG